MAVTGLITVVVVVGLLSAFTYAGFLYGQDRAESRAHNTIANLRRANMALRHRLDRVEERNNRLARALGESPTPRVEVPEWMRP